MRYLGEDNQIVDCTKQENLGEKICEFVITKSDYFNNFYLQWSRNESEMYRIEAGNTTFDIGTGLYVFAGIDYNFDFFQIDELIGRDLQIFTINPRATKFDTFQFNLKETYYGTYYYPATKNPLPVVSACGTKCIIVSQTDQYRNIADIDLFSELVL